MSRIQVYSYIKIVYLKNLALTFYQKLKFNPVNDIKKKAPTLGAGLFSGFKKPQAIFTSYRPCRPCHPYQASVVQVHHLSAAQLPWPLLLTKGLLPNWHSGAQGVSP